MAASCGRPVPLSDPPGVISKPVADRLVDAEEDKSGRQRGEERVDTELGDEEPVDETHRCAGGERDGEREPDVPVHRRPGGHERTQDVDRPEREVEVPAR